MTEYQFLSQSQISIVINNHFLELTIFQKFIQIRIGTFDDLFTLENESWLPKLLNNLSSQSMEIISWSRWSDDSIVLSFINLIPETLVLQIELKVIRDVTKESI